MLGYRGLRHLGTMCHYIMWHMEDTQGIRRSLCGFMKGRSCVTNLTFYDKVTYLPDEGKAVDVVRPDFSKAFDTVSYSVLLVRLSSCGLDS